MALNLNTDLMFQAIENIYSGEMDLSKDRSSSMIFEPHLFEINKTVIDNSRYVSPTSNSNFQPYRINKQCLANLFSRIVLLPYSGPRKISTSTNMESIVVDSSTEVLYIYNIDLGYFHKDLLFLGSITPLGLLAIRMRNYFKNTEFKKKVEDYLSAVYKVVLIGTTKYFFDPVLSSSFEGITTDKNKKLFLDQLLDSGMVFSWKRD